MAAAVHTAPQQIRHLEITMLDGHTRHMAVEQLPDGYRLDLATLVNMWMLYSHMQGKTYPTVEAFLDDAHPGWQRWREEVRLPIMTNAQETAVVKAALKNAGIRPKSVSHYLGPVIIEMRREDACEGEFLQILRPHPAGDRGYDRYKDSLHGHFVFLEFHGKQRPAMKNSVGTRVD
jgi:hypothetical protein